MQVTVEVGADRTTVDYTVGPAAPAIRFGVAATVAPPGGTWRQRAVQQYAAGARCFYVYYGPGERPVWADRCGDVPADCDIWCQTLNVDPAVLRAFVASVPPRQGRVYWHYQNEPRPKVQAGTMTLQQYRERTTVVHSTIPPGHRSLVPAQEFQELDLRPASAVDMRPYLVPTTRHVGWSVYDIYSQVDPVAQVGRVAAFMAAYPALTWGVAAAGRPVDQATGTPNDRARRAAWFEASYNAARDAGATEYCWYDRLGIDGRDFQLDPPMTAALTRVRAQ